MRDLRCVVGWHHWHDVEDAEDHAAHIECYRCGTREPTPKAVALRFGFPAHRDS